jgi:ParB family transcriptional regulator, chromosome partitioning protein
MNMPGGKGHPPFFANASVMALDPADVLVPEGIGFLHEDKAVALGRLMAVDGQRDPIKVKERSGKPKQRWQLVTGRHRLRGAELEGLPIYALEVFGEAEDIAEMEASENLHRRPLQPIERAKFTAALVKAAQERIAREHGDNLSQQQLAIKARWDKVRGGEIRAEQALKDETDDTSATMADVYGWEESVSDSLGMSKRTIHRDLALYRLLIEPFPELAEPLSKHPVVGENAAQLKAIAAVRDEAQRRQVIEQLLGDPELSADEARVHAGIDGPGNRAPTPYEKFSSQLTGAWGRFSGEQRSRFVRDGELVKLLTPGLMRELREQIDRELGE